MQKHFRNSKAAIMPKPDLLITESDGELCRIVGKILNNPKNMKVCIEMLKAPTTKKQAVFALKVYMYAGIGVRSVPEHIFAMAELAEYPNGTEDDRYVYTGTPPSADRTRVAEFVSQLVIPPNQNGEAKLGSAVGRLAVSKKAKDLKIQAGRLEIMEQQPPSLASVTEERDLLQNELQLYKDALNTWKMKAKAIHEALILWMTYAMVPDKDTDEFPDINTHIDAPLTFPPLDDPTGDDGVYGGVKPVELTYTNTPHKKRRVTYHSTPPAATPV